MRAAEVTHDRADPGGRVLGGVSRGVQVVDPDLEDDQRRPQAPESPAADAVAQVLGAVAAETEGDGRQLTELEVTRPVPREPLGDGVAEEDDLGLLVERLRERLERSKGVPPGPAPSPL